MVERETNEVFAPPPLLLSTPSQNPSPSFRDDGHRLMMFEGGWGAGGDGVEVSCISSPLWFKGRRGS